LTARSWSRPRMAHSRGLRSISVGPRRARNSRG
jgi:hypothetical protein